MTDTVIDQLDDIEELPAEDAEGATAEGKAEKAPKAPAKPKIEFGATWLAAHVSEQLGKPVDGKAIRIVLRALASKGLIEQAKGSRYEFSGADDPRVALVIAEFRTRGEAKAAKGPRKSRAAKGEATDEPVLEDEDAPVEDLEDLNV